MKITFFFNCFIIFPMILCVHKLPLKLSFQFKANKRMRKLEDTIKVLKEQISEGPNKNYGSAYVRWARKQCPTNNTEMVYSGYAAGGMYNEKGSSAEPVCLPVDPDFEKQSGPNHGRIYGAEFDNNFFAPNSLAHDVPCAVCVAKMATSVIMIAGKKRCYPGWKIEYHGYLASNHYNYEAAGTYVCIDINPEFVYCGSANHDGKLFWQNVVHCTVLHISRTIL